MNNKIKNIEFNFCNLCSAGCYICSKEHGSKNENLMFPKVFDLAAEQLKEIDFDRIHTSGNGDAFFNPHFIDYLRKLNKLFPNATIDFYTNFYNFNPELAHVFVSERLVKEIHIRVDSLYSWIFEKTTGLDYDTVFNNIKYFLKINDGIRFYINYANPAKYHDRVKKVLNKDPYYSLFTADELKLIKDEYNDIQNYFNPLSKNKIEYNRISFSLWAERINCQDDFTTKCPKINVIKNTIWISPSGTVQLCCYDDRQYDLTYGNIFDKTILDLWNSAERKEFIKKIENREIKAYPCNNPKCCSMEAL